MPKKPMTVPEEIDAEMATPTPREEKVAELIEKNKDVKPQIYDITSRNEKAVRVIHDFHGNAITIQPNETVTGIPLLPNTAEYLGKGDLTLKGSM